MEKIDEFLREAREGVVTVEFEKINGGGLRIMPCTLNSKASEGRVPSVFEQRQESDHIAVWALDKKAWRSFRVNTVTKWYKGYPEHYKEEGK